MRKDILFKLFILICTFGIIFSVYLFKNRENYEQSEAKQTLEALGQAEESYYKQFKKYTIQTEELGIDFSRLSNISIHFTVESLPLNIKLSEENKPKVNIDSFRIIALFKTSTGKLQVWKLEEGVKIELLQTI